MGNEEVRIIGVLSQEVINLLELDFEAGTPIYIGELNIEHMQQNHPIDFKKYGRKIDKIISNPDYVGLNDKDESIEYIKEFGQYVKIAVRITNKGALFVRSLYHINDRQISQWIEAGRLIPLT